MAKRNLYKLLNLAMGVASVCFLGCQPRPVENTTSIPNLPVEHGVSAPFAGLIGRTMIVGGGCNFPTVPAADGGKKVYYPDLYACNLETDSIHWVRQADFNEPVAYGATVEVDQSLVCIGGSNAQTSLKEVVYIHVDSVTGEVHVDALPSLPESIDNAAAASIDRSIYVTGGNQGGGGKSLYTLTVGKDTAWTKLSDYPGPKRIQPVLLAANNELFLFGGFESNATTHTATISSNFIVYNTAEGKWSAPQDIPTMKDGSPRALVGSAGASNGKQLFLAGGVNYSIFKRAVEGKGGKDYMKHPAAWYQFSKDVLVYDLATKTWQVVPGIEGFNKAGGSLLIDQNTLYMVCGEIKPGVRTNEIVGHSLDELTAKNLE